MVRFIVVRHGLTTYNKLHIYQGQYDSPLDEVGIRQAEYAAERLAAEFRIDAIYASDLSRTVDTATPLANRLGLEIRKDAGLREIDVGDWSNRPVAEVWKESSEAVRTYRETPGIFRFPNGETFAEVIARASAVFERIAAEHDGETVAVFSHGGTIRSVLAYWQGIPVEEMHRVKTLPNTAVTVAEYENGKVTITLLGDNSHLPEDLR